LTAALSFKASDFIRIIRGKIDGFENHFKNLETIFQSILKSDFNNTTPAVTPTNKTISASNTNNQKKSEVISIETFNFNLNNEESPETVEMLKKVVYSYSNNHDNATIDLNDFYDLHYDFYLSSPFEFEKLLHAIWKF
jgi:hypothetical protein